MCTRNTSYCKPTKVQQLRLPFFLPSKLLHNLLLLPLVEDEDVTVGVSFGKVCCTQKKYVIKIYFILNLDINILHIYLVEVLNKFYIKQIMHL